MNDFRHSLYILRKWGRVFKPRQLGHCKYITHSINNPASIQHGYAAQRLLCLCRLYSSQQRSHPSSKQEDEHAYDADGKLKDKSPTANTNVQLHQSSNNEEHDYYSSLLEYYTKKAEQDIDYMDDVDYHDVQNLNKRLYYKIVDAWLKEVGSTKRGHRDFIRILLNSMKRFEVEADIKAYLKLIDCFPDGKHTGIKRGTWFKAAFQDKIADHGIAIKIMVAINQSGAIPNDKLFNKTTDLFGKFSPATWHARAVMFWHPRIVAANPFPVTQSQLKELTPIEVAFHGLRQMNPGIDAHYANIAVDKSQCGEILDADKIDSVVSVQTHQQQDMLAQHDTTKPIYIEGPNLTMFRSKKVQYYVMRADPQEKKLQTNTKPQRTTLISTKEWWTEFYDTDWKTGRKRVINIDEHLFPEVDVVDGYHDSKKQEIMLVEKDVEKVEGPVYAIACTDYNSPAALQSWVRGLLPQNPILCDCSIVFRKEDAFMFNAPTEDPNESYYDNLELPYDAK